MCRAARRIVGLSLLLGVLGRAPTTSAQEPARRRVPTDTRVEAAGAAGASGAAEEDPGAVYEVPVSPSDPQSGPATALVTLVAFLDYQCAFCARALPTLRSLRARFGDALRIVWRDHPLAHHPHAMGAAELAREARAELGSEGFDRAQRLLFERALELGGGGLDRVAAEIGLDATRWRAARAARVHRAAIESDIELATRLGAPGVPTFFVNGVVVRGVPSFDGFVRVLQAQAARAEEALRARLATPETLYAVLTRGGATRGPVRSAAAEPVAAPAQEEAALDQRCAAVPRATPPSGQDVVYALPVPASAPSRGPAGAPLVLQWVGDLQCPFTARVAATILQLLERYPRELRVVWRDYPLGFHASAREAAEAARAVFELHGAESFWRFVGQVFEGQTRLRDPSGLWDLLQDTPGVDVGRVRSAVRTGRQHAAVQADLDAIRDAGAAIGTPSFFLDGRRLSGARPLADFVAFVEAALARRAGARAAPAR